MRLVLPRSWKYPVLLMTCILMGGARFAHGHQDAAVNASPVRVTLLRDTPAGRSETSLLLRIRNSSEKPLALALGAEMNGGYAGVYLKALSIEIIDSHGVSSTWEPLNAGVISGRLDPFVILLLPHAELTLPFSLSQLMGSKSPGIQVLPKGPITLKAKLTCSVPKFESFSWDIRGIANMPFWTGVTYSNPLRLSAH